MPHGRFPPTEATFAAGAEVIGAGAISQTFYIVEQGTFHYPATKEAEGATYARGDSFGEMALVYDVENTGVALSCITAGRLWGLHRGDFRSLLTAARQKRLHKATRFLEGVGIPASISDEQMWKLSEALEVVSYADGATIWVQRPAPITDVPRRAAAHRCAADGRRWRP